MYCFGRWRHIYSSGRIYWLKISWSVTATDHLSWKVPSSFSRQETRHHQSLMIGSIGYTCTCISLSAHLLVISVLLAAVKFHHMLIQEVSKLSLSYDGFVQFRNKKVKLCAMSDVVSVNKISCWKLQLGVLFWIHCNPLVMCDLLGTCHSNNLCTAN